MIAALAAIVLFSACDKEKNSGTGFTGIYSNPVLLWGTPKADVMSYTARQAKAFNLPSGIFCWGIFRETGTLYTFKDDGLAGVFVYVQRSTKKELEEWLSGQYDAREKGGWLTGDGKTVVALSEESEEGIGTYFVVSYSPKQEDGVMSEVLATRAGFSCPKCGRFINFSLAAVIQGMGFSCQGCGEKVEVFTIR